MGARQRWKSGDLVGFALVGDVTGFVTALSAGCLVSAESGTKTAGSTYNDASETSEIPTRANRFSLGRVLEQDGIPGALRRHQPLDLEVGAALLRMP